MTWNTIQSAGAQTASYFALAGAPVTAFNLYKTGKALAKGTKAEKIDAAFNLFGQVGDLGNHAITLGQLLAGEGVISQSALGYVVPLGAVTAALSAAETAKSIYQLVKVVGFKKDLK